MGGGIKMLLTDFQAIILMLKNSWSAIWVGLDNVVFITSPRITLLDFLLAMIVIDLALDVLIALRED